MLPRPVLTSLRAACLALPALLAACGGHEAPPAAPAVQTASMSASSAASVVRTPEDYHPALQQIYVAYFGRPADPAGVAYFAKYLAQSNAPTDVRGMLDVAGSNSVVGSLIQNLSLSEESRTLYRGDTDAFLRAIYLNVLGRSPDPAGFAFWKNALVSGAVQPGTAALWILVSATAPGNDDAALLAKKLAAAAVFTGSLNTPMRTQAYEADGADSKARNFLRGIQPGTDDRVVAQQALRMVDDLVLAFSPGSVTLRGTVAVGAPVQGAIVEAYDQDGFIGDAQTLADGTFEIFPQLRRALAPPYKLKAEFTLAGRKISLFSVSTDDTGRNPTINITPISDMITRTYDPPPRVPSPELVWINEPSRLDRITDAVKKTLGGLLPADAPDPIRSIMVADPRLNPYDAALERISIASSETQSTLSDSQGKVLATVSHDVLAAGTPPTDATGISDAEAAAAIAARGPLTGPVAPRVNEAKLPAPGGFQATRTGDLKFRLRWDRVPGVHSYWIFQQKDTPPVVTPGTYKNADLVPTLAVIGGTDVDYKVDEPGLYYWVVVGVADDGSVLTHTLGYVSEPVSLNFSNQPAEPVLTRSSKCADWRKLIDGRVWTVVENHGAYDRNATGGTFLFEKNTLYAATRWKATGPTMRQWTSATVLEGPAQVNDWDNGQCRYLIVDQTYGTSLLHLFMISYENGALKVSYEPNSEQYYMIWR